MLLPQLSAIVGTAATIAAAAGPLRQRFNCSGKAPAFFLAGDSTTATQSINGGGWGNGFLSFLRSPAWGVNYGHNGATTVSFVNGGDWATVLGQVENATRDFDVFVTIQFGHNDQKAAANISLLQYQANLEHLAGQVRTAGGEPVLVTPLTRRVFSAPHTAVDSLHDQRLATIAAGQAVSARVLDLNLASLAYVDALGSVDAQVYDLNGNDSTHLNARGSVVFGRMVADLLLGHPPALDVAPLPTVSANIETTRAKIDRYFAKWIVSNETLSWEIWHGVLA